MCDELSDSEWEQLLRLSRKVLWSSPATRKKLQQHRINVIPANFYSTVPSIEEIENSFEYLNSDDEVFNYGVFDDNTMSEFIASIEGYSEEFCPPEDGDLENPTCFFWNNPAFSYADAMAYYCIIRHFKPLQILEVGSGFSTLVANEALLKNGKGKLVLIEPYPKEFLSHLETVDLVVKKFAQSIPVHDFVSLVEDSDIWFIDSTHTVKIGSDCLYLYLKIMPNISKHMIVHSHDIFLPYGMPQKPALESQIYWTEQYLLYAYFLNNPKTKVLFGSVYANRNLLGKMEKWLNGKTRARGASLWFELNF